MSNSKKKKKNLKRKLTHNDNDIKTSDGVGRNDKVKADTSVKKGKNRKFGKKKMSMSSQGSTSYSTTSSKEFMNQVMGDREDHDKAKAQCDLCKLSYASQDKLKEHLVSLMHHTKLEDAEKHSSHDCSLCNKTFDDMSSYREHIGMKKHLEKLEALRGHSEGKGNEGDGMNKKTNGQRHQMSAHFPSHFNKNSKGFQENSWSHNGNRYGNFQNNHQQNSYHWSNDVQENQHRGFTQSHGQGGQSHNYYNEQQSNLNNSQYNQMGYDGPADWDGPQYYDNFGCNYNPHNGWGKSKNNTRWRNNWDQQGDMKGDNRENGNRNVPWGSGASDFRQRQTQGFRQRNYGHHRNSNYHHNMNNFVDDNFDNCWDEQSFREHEDFLAGIDQGGYTYEDSVEFHHQGRQSQQQFDPRGDKHRPITEGLKKGKWDRPSGNDRKRARYEDYYVNTEAKSSKPFEERTDIDNGDPGLNESDNADRYQSSSCMNIERNHSKNVHPQGRDRLVFREKDKSLDNASDTILERAERLCKELREKREASNSHRENLLKSHSHGSINDKMNNLKKSQQSYLKGHIKGITKDSTLTGNSLDQSSSSSVPDSTKTPPQSLSNRSSSSSGKIKTLEEIRKSIEKSVMEDVQNSSASVAKSPSRRRTSSLGESSLSTSSQRFDGLNSKVGNQSMDSDERQAKLPPRMDSTVSSSKAISVKTGSKQAITKEDLHKMVNCPRARTERVHLARMIQSRGDNKSSAPISSRGNINLEGLYDSSVSDLQLDIGDDMATIKLEELSDDVRSQILGLIQNDIGPMLGDEPQKLSSDGEKGRKKDIQKVHSLSSVKDSSVKKWKNKNLSDKKKSKNSASDYNADRIVPELDNISGSDSVSHGEKSRNGVSIVTPSQQRVTSQYVPKKLTSQAESAIKNVSKGPLDSLKQSHKKCEKALTEHQNSSLTEENVSSKYPTIMRTLCTKSDKRKSDPVDKRNDKSLVDGGQSSLSLPSSSLLPSSTLLSKTSSSPVSYTPAILSSQSIDVQDPSHPSSSSNFLSVSAGMVSLLDIGNLDDQHGLSPRTDHSKDPKETLRSMTSSLVVSESSSTMSELLTLSEQEEHVKQEMMNMELRLTRLHRLLEQAVNQINKCTERRTQLQDEEKILTRKRISLLREATSSSSQQGLRSRPSESSHDTSLDVASSHIHVNPASSYNVNTCDYSNQSLPQTAATSLTSVPLNQDSDGTPTPESSLSKSQWLAKFSAYLPKDIVISSKDSNQDNVNLHTESASSKNQSSSSLLSSRLPSLQKVPERDMKLESAKNKKPSAVSILHAVSDSHNCNDQPVTDVESVNLMSVNNEESTSAGTHEFRSPIMYVGTIKSSGNKGDKDRLPAPIMMINSDTISSLFNDVGDRSVNINPLMARNSGIIENSIPPVNRRNSIGSPRQDDSDIGSIASVASGSSLGEQISLYCRYTPGATLESQNPHELSVILSGPSDTSELKELDEPQDCDDDNDNREMNQSVTNSKVMELREDMGNNRLYGHLNQESVKSAEALHLIERSTEVPTTSSGKKKKRKTKHQRDTGILRRPKPYVISSSSADEVETGKNVGDSCVTNLEKRMMRGMESTTDDSSSDAIRPDQTDPTVAGSGLSVSSPNKTNKGTEITVAECDSSTGLGIVDSESLNERSSRLKQMNESFEKNFGRKPTFMKESATTSKTSTCKKAKSSSIVILSDSDDKQDDGGIASNSNIIDLCDDDDDGSRQCHRNLSTVAGSNIDLAKSSRFPADLGHVCYVNFQNEKVYTGILQYGFKVMSAVDNFASDKHYTVPKLSCMEMAVVDWDDRVFVGSGDCVRMFHMESGLKLVVDVGTSVKCLHVMGQTLFAGLDTGEIYAQNIKTWEKKNRYICSDCPIHCMASGKEGFTKLLCVASQDSTITVVDADHSLPLRILVGHSKTAFSVQVHGQYVFSGSGDNSVIIHNLHTARVEKVFKDNKGMVNCVCYSQGYLFTGGMDRLVRCYNVKTYKLVQVYYGADMGPIKALCVHEDKFLITGNSMGSVDVLNLDLKARNLCTHRRCGLNFGIAAHLSWHIEHEH